MEPNLTKADFRVASKLEGAPGELLRLANQQLATELTISLSAFLRTSVVAKFALGEEISFGSFPIVENKASFGMAILRPGDRKLIVAADHAVLLPLVGVALGAKAGSFTPLERKPTEIELQVVGLLYRLILADAYRCWGNLTKTTIETVTLEFEAVPGRTLAATDPVFAVRFELTAGEQTGQLTLLAPPELFATDVEEEQTAPPEAIDSNVTTEATLEVLLDGDVSMQVWLEGSEMRLGDLLRLSEGQIVRLDHPVERMAACTLNGISSFSGQIVSTGRHRAFQIEDSIR